MNEVTLYGTQTCLFLLHFPCPISRQALVAHVLLCQFGARHDHSMHRRAGLIRNVSIFYVWGWVSVYTLSFVLRSVGQARDQVQGLCIPGEMIRFYLPCAQNKKQVSYIDRESTLLCISPVMASLMLTNHKFLLLVSIFLCPVVLRHIRQLKEGWHILRNLPAHFMSVSPISIFC